MNKECMCRLVHDDRVLPLACSTLGLYPLSFYDHLPIVFVSTSRRWSKCLAEMSAISGCASGPRTTVHCSVAVKITPFPRARNRSAAQLIPFSFQDRRVKISPTSVCQFGSVLFTSCSTDKLHQVLDTPTTGAAGLRQISLWVVVFTTCSANTAPFLSSIESERGSRDLQLMVRYLVCVRLLAMT
jgi:hypothetical protein